MSMALVGQIIRRAILSDALCFVKKPRTSLVCTSFVGGSRQYQSVFSQNFVRRCPPPSAILITSQKRFKYSKQAKIQEESSDEEDEDGLKEDENSKIVTGRMASLRADNVIKSGLNLARNKVETMFYEGRIRVNGSGISKKSQKVLVGDEIDLVKGFSQLNENFLIISRVVVLSCRMNDEGDDLVVKLRRFKNLTVENYTQEPWKKPKTD